MLLNLNIICRDTNDELDAYYIDDFVNHPDIVSHPAFPILERQALQYQNNQGSSPRQDLIGDIFRDARQDRRQAFGSLRNAFSSRQGFAGLASVLGSQGSVRH